MEGPSHAAVTPDGVRGGDPAVLEALIARRGPAVLAFCEAVCEPAVAARAAAEAFARFRALVVAVPDAGGVDPEQFLIGATRHAAAAMARPPAEERGVLRSIGRATSPETTAAVPALLAARADSMLGAEDLERLTRLLERSASCREVEAAFRRAEQGYRSPPPRELRPDTVALIVATMQAAAPVDPAFNTYSVPAPDIAPEGGIASPVADLGDDGGDRHRDAPDLPAAPPPEPDVDAVTVLPVPEPADQPTDGEPARPDAHAPFLLADDDPDKDTDDGYAGLPPVPLADQTLITRADAAAAAIDPIYAPPPRPKSRIRAALRLPHGGGLHLPRRPGARDGAQANADHGPVFRILLPALAILIAILVMLAVAGVFGGDAAAPALIVLQP